MKKITAEEFDNGEDIDEYLNFSTAIRLKDVKKLKTETKKQKKAITEKAVSTYFDTLDEMISDKRIDELKAGKTEVYSLEEVAQRLGLY